MTWTDGSIGLTSPYFKERSVSLDCLAEPDVFFMLLRVFPVPDGSKETLGNGLLWCFIGSRRGEVWRPQTKSAIFSEVVIRIAASLRQVRNSSVALVRDSPDYSMAKSKWKGSALYLTNLKNQSVRGEIHRLAFRLIATSLLQESKHRFDS